MEDEQRIRQKAIEVIVDHPNRSRAELLKAVFDLRHHDRSDDAALLRPLLAHEDDGVVASVMYSLFSVYERREEMEVYARKRAEGDERDREDMPIQCRAIWILAEIGPSDPSIWTQLIAIGEDEATADVPRKDAWQRLSEILGIPWKREYSDEMILSPESDASGRIRSRIRVVYDREMQKKSTLEQ